ncbi:hypothetical protein [uncultured Maribacter sp.]|uniref:hypothetical protein n=1 Tax=uncultured Maribacter sp. TaxID=431308 RepID=UPI0034397D3C
MKKRTPISEIMTKEGITLNTGNTLDKAEHLFKKHCIDICLLLMGRSKRYVKLY